MQFDPKASSSALSTIPSLGQPLLPQKRSFSESQSSTSFQPHSSQEAGAPRAKQPRIDPSNSPARSRSNLNTEAHARYLHTAVQAVPRSRNARSRPTFAPEFAMPSFRNTPLSPRLGQSASPNQPRNTKGNSQPQIQSVVVAAGQLQEPLRDLAFIQSNYNPKQDVPLNPTWIDNPKSPLTNYVGLKTKRFPVYNITQGNIASKNYYRCARFYPSPQLHFS